MGRASSSHTEKSTRNACSSNENVASFCKPLPVARRLSWIDAELLGAELAALPPPGKRQIFLDGATALQTFACSDDSACLGMRSSDARRRFFGVTLALGALFSGESHSVLQFSVCISCDFVHTISHRPTKVNDYFVIAIANQKLALRPTQW